MSQKIYSYLQNILREVYDSELLSSGNKKKLLKKKHTHTSSVLL